MDIKQTIRGHEYTVCCPDSWYIAKQIITEHHDEYTLEYEKLGTNAKINFTQNRKMVDFYDKEHITWIKSNTPPRSLGVLYWTNDELNKVILKLKKEEADYAGNEKEGCFYIFHDIFKYLRDYDLIEIKTSERNLKGQEIPMVYITSKEWINKSGYVLNENEYGLQCVINKSLFKKIPDTKKIGVKPKKAGVAWMKKNKRKS